MRVLAVNQFYAPDLAATSQLLRQLCEDLVASGDEVTVIASPGDYRGGARLPPRERIGGVEVIRPWASGLGRASIAHRLVDYLSFWASSVARAAVERRPDVILALSTPPMIALGAALVARARHIPLVCWVQDVYPDLAVAFGLLGERHPLSRLLRALGRATYRASWRTVALSDGMAARLQAQGAPPERTRVIANWADGKIIYPVPHEQNPFRAEHGLEGRFVVGYSGNLGMAHDVASLVEAARLLGRSHPEALVLFIGEGARRGEAQELSRDLDNVRFLPYQPHEQLALSLSAADVHLVSLRAGLDGLVVPSKLYGILAAGRPVFYLGPARCEVARVVRRHELGWTGGPGKSTELAAALGRAARDRPWTAACGQRARRVFAERYDRPVAVARWRAVLDPTGSA